MKFDKVRRLERPGLEIKNSPICARHPFATLFLLPQPYRTIETINYLRSQDSLKPVIPKSYKLPDGLKIDVNPASVQAEDAVTAALRIPSPYEFQITDADIIDLSASPANRPALAGGRDPLKHAQRLDVCRALTIDLIEDLIANRFQVRSDYRDHLMRYLKRLPSDDAQGNILLADAAARSLRSMFASDADMLSAAFASQLKTLLEHHIGLRVYYPEVAEFYNDVQTGRVTETLSLDAVEDLIHGVEANTPSVFAPRVAPSLRESTDILPQPAIDYPSLPRPIVDQEAPQPPKDPLGELNPQAARDMSIAAWSGRLLNILKKGETIGKNVEGFQRAYQTISPVIKKILHIVFGAP